MKALVVFHDHGRGFWPWLFGCPGFRHCFVCVSDGRVWIVCEVHADRMELTADAPADFDLAGFYRDAGYTVVGTRVREPATAPWVPRTFTCVEAVRRVLGIDDWRVWTPRQLYLRLRKGETP